MTQQNDSPVETHRRSVLASVGLLSGIGSLRMVGDTQAETDSGYVLIQGDRCIPITPLSGSKTVEAFYDYWLPERYVSEENGARTGPSSEYNYSSAGTTTYQRPSTSNLFLYEGTKGLSLVVIHGKVNDGDSGGSVTFRIEGLPSNGRWVVKDDLYRNPDTGEIAMTNYDRWRTDDSVHTIDWTWGAKTDGGAFRDLGSESMITIHPSFNEAANLYGEHYEGTVAEWHLLSDEGDSIRRIPLDMTEPVVIRSGGCTAQKEPTQTSEQEDTSTKEHEETAEETEEKEEEDSEKAERKHEKKQAKHEAKEAKHEAKEARKHAKEQAKHEAKEAKHEAKKASKHEK